MSVKTEAINLAEKNLARQICECNLIPFKSIQPLFRSLYAYYGTGAVLGILHILYLIRANLHIILKTTR